jgi:hypothetical protein
MTDRRWRLLLATVMVLVLIERVVLLFVFGFRYTGTDDVILWEMARDYGNGFFPEPYLYGQNYNPVLEALLGAPFVRSGVHPSIVLPIITSLLALAPFFSFALWHFRRGEHRAALAFAVMPLLLPVEWDMLTTMPRGFVQGLALLAFLPWTMSIRNEKLRHTLTALVAGAAIFFNANTLVFLVPVGVVLLFEHARKPWFWIGSAMGLMPAALAWWEARAFYLAYPYEMHHMIMGWEVQFHPFLIGQAVTRLDSHFKGLTPVLWNEGHAILWYLLLACIALFLSHRKAQAWGVAAGLAFVCFALGFYKVHDGVDSIFFARSRMFLATPLLLAWAITGIRVRKYPPWSIMLAIVLLAAALKAFTMPRAIAHELTHQKGALVREQAIDEVRQRCEATKAAAWEYGADAIVTLRWPDIRVDPEPHFQTYFDCYACSHLVDGLPMTYGPGYDRRAWVRNAVRDKIPREPLFVGGDPAAWQRIDDPDMTIVPLGSQPLLHLIRNNTTPIDSIIVRWHLAQMR